MTEFAGERILTWQEAIDLVRGKRGMYPELKSPPLYTARGLDMVKLFVDAVKKNGMDTADSLRSTPVIIQSFDEAAVRRATDLIERAGARDATEAFARAHLNTALAALDTDGLDPRVTGQLRLVAEYVCERQL